MLSTKDYLPIYSFTALQHFRTMNGKIHAEQMVGHLSDEIVGSILGPDSDVKLVYPGMHLSMIANALEGIPLFFDLGMVLFVNNTDRDFISSDHPVAFTNSYFSKVRNWGVLGIQSPGLQIYSPISRRLALFLYDVECYSTKHRGLDASTIPINSVEDVEALNGLQFVTCTENNFLLRPRTRKICRIIT